MKPAPRFRNLAGGLIDRSEPVAFRFDGRAYVGYRGDTLASALLAHGVRVFARSLKYHRPRGVLSAGAEEPNALVTVGRGAHAEPNLRATQVRITPGLVARSQNRWPSLTFDLGAVAGLFKPLLAAGFQYKTFMWPQGGWRFYEWFLRRAAGLGRSSALPDPGRYDRTHRFCDVLVVGGGPSGLAATAAAARAGARVILVEEQPTLGGALRGERRFSEGRPLVEWVDEIERELDADPRVTLLRNATAFGYYDRNLMAVSERLDDAAPADSNEGAPPPRQRLHHIRAREIVLATGAQERPIVFPGNDRPGVMLASAARVYANQYAVRIGERAVVFANNDSAYSAAVDVARAGVEVVAVVDSRPDGPIPAWREMLDELGIELVPGCIVTGVRGRRRVRGALVRKLTGEPQRGRARFIACDAILMSGGWSPAVQLVAQSQGRLWWEESLGALVPREAGQPQHWAGAITGEMELPEVWASGVSAGEAAARAALEATSGTEENNADAATASYTAALELPPLDPGLGNPETLGPPALYRQLWSAPEQPGAGAFVDFQNDVTAADIELAVRESHASVEHFKRYTTLGMGTDQGRTANVNALPLLARELGVRTPEVGHTRWRPPVAPVTLGLLAAERAGPHLAPTRESPMQAWHLTALAACKRDDILRPVGLWHRPFSYPRPGESALEAANREARHVRNAAGLVDVSTLGKIELRGEGAGAFLERIYVNHSRPLAVGRVRYGLMLRDDGHVFDDGVVARLDDDRYYLTTTTHGVDEVMRHLEFHAETVWPELGVAVVDVTDQWAAMALSGPRSRDILLAALDPDDDEARARAEALGFMHWMEADIAQVPARILRVTFSGELGYEVHVPADWGLRVWEWLLARGGEFGIEPYGTEAMGILRIEKGRIAGAELDGRTTPIDLGFGAMLPRAADGDDGEAVRPIGHWGLSRPMMRESGRKQLVGLRGEKPIPAGAQLLDLERAARYGDGQKIAITSLGHVTSAAWSPNLEADIALAIVRDGRARMGETLVAMSPVTGEEARVTVCEPMFLDRENARARA